MLKNLRHDKPLQFCFIYAGIIVGGSIAIIISNWMF
jgi:hypothetical protein